MDVATVVGLMAGLGLMGVAILLGGDAAAFFNLPGLIIVLGGTAASTLIHYPLKEVLSVAGCLRRAFVERPQTPDRLIERLAWYAAHARRDGVLSLDSRYHVEDDPFLRRGLQMAIDGTPPEQLREVLHTEIAFLEERHAASQNILVSMGTFAPAYGMIGTLVGLVHMFVTLNDPTRIGQGMAVAILTTLYGALLANLVFLPAAGKLRVRTQQEILEKELIVEGIASLQAGDNPYLVEQKLKSFVAPAVRERVRPGRRDAAA